MCQLAFRTASSRSGSLATACLFDRQSRASAVNCGTGVLQRSVFFSYDSRIAMILTANDIDLYLFFAKTSAHVCDGVPEPRHRIGADLAGAAGAGGGR
jgi:hypothetical protein